MFTGIIESLGVVEKITNQGSNIHFQIASPISRALKIDQSVSHNGVCLTVVDLSEGAHAVTAVLETLQRSNMGQLHKGSIVNLERSMSPQSLLDGHIVQGHVDTTAICTEVVDLNGSWRFRFRFQPSPEHLLVDKGSITVNGVSLTVVEPKGDLFSVAIIPYTFEHTNFQTLKPGDSVNLEFDIIGKYIARYMQLYQK